MGKLNTATWVQGAMFALGYMSLIPTVAKADYQVYYPQNNPYHVQKAAYRPRDNQNYQQWQQANLAIPPELQPYPNQTQTYYPARTARLSNYNPYYQQPRQQTQAAPVARSNKLNPAREAILKSAYRAIGTSYRWGGNTPREGFDCSGLTKFTHKNVNLSIPRTALEQSKASRTISRQQLKPGDMIFFRTSGKTVNHVGIYVGDGKFIHAASGGGKVTLDDLRRNYWQQRLVKYGTFLA